MKPGLEGREAIFRLYLSKVKHEASLDVARLARKVVGKSPAEIENIIKEAALIATRNGKDLVTLKELSEAIERIELGIKHRVKMTEHEREMTAYHETGHLIVTYLLHPRNDVFKASIIPRKGTLGVVHPQPREEWFADDKAKILADIKCFLAGYVGEKQKFGVTSNGVAADFQAAMQLAHLMVWKFGMGENGLVGDFTIIPEHQLSEEMKNRLNQETNRVVQSCLKEVETLLTEEKEIFERFAKELLQKNELEYDEIEAIFAEYGKPNPRLLSGMSSGEGPISAKK
jgi:cell division protease FtsH